ncbi:MAG: hypothetical protein IKM20_08550 [Erysipelotrichales bacterium]|nr:hypothetical protein [Erysipelotrichales bacterium]
MKKCSVSMIAFLMHLIISVLLSFDWPFLEGMYLGFGFTFLIIWGYTLPILTALISIVRMLVRIKKKEKLNISEVISAVTGCIILLIYCASATGLLRHFTLSFIYMFVFIGMLFIWGTWCYMKIKSKSYRN